MDFVTWNELTALMSVIVIDLALAGDNAIIVGMAAAGLRPDLRMRAIVIGIAAATVMRIAFASVTVQLLEIVGLLAAGGLLLLWVSWKLWRELREGAAQAAAAGEAALEGGPVPIEPVKTLRQAVIQILIADLTMSLDNVLAVAGAARDHEWVLIVGLALSVAFMGLAASVVARLLLRHRWIAYVGLALIVYVAVSMIWDGTAEILVAVHGD